jgi:ribulose-5-phosphate 4-epimerase/fuculose-1-phosphate aldolase
MLFEIIASHQIKSNNDIHQSRYHRAVVHSHSPCGLVMASVKPTLNQENVNNVPRCGAEGVDPDKRASQDAC